MWRTSAVFSAPLPKRQRAGAFQNLAAEKGLVERCKEDEFKVRLAKRLQAKTTVSLKMNSRMTEDGNARNLTQLLHLHDRNHAKLRGRARKM